MDQSRINPLVKSEYQGVDYDVIIAGGGLAGLCLAKQLREAAPELSVLVCERVRSPLPIAAYKVGESTVEIGAYYFSEVLGLRDYLASAHIEKLGLRYFYGGRHNFSDEAEFGVARFLPAKSYQLDRGAFEDHLRKVTVDSGAVLAQGLQVVDITLDDADGPHTVICAEDDIAEGSSLTCRWVIDATGRRRLLQRKLGLTRSFPTRHNAVWFRLAGRLDIDMSVTAGEPAWHQRVHGPRWNSTNHIMFEGGWIWFIPLAPDHTSVGIVTSEALHPINAFSRVETAIDFIVDRIPDVEPAIKSLPVLDFHVLRNYSHSSNQAFSKQRWACVGEAAAFADPYYSVGSNMIAYANGFATKMIIDDYNGELTDDYVRHANRYFLSLIEGLTNSIQLSYPFHNNPVIMALKTIWDFYVGWAFSDPQYYSGTYLDMKASSAISGIGSYAIATQASIMRLFADWAKQYNGVFSFEFIDYYQDLPTLARLFMQNLPHPHNSQFTSVIASIRDGVNRIEELAHVIFYMALEDAMPERAAQVRAQGWLNTSAISLDADNWERDGLFVPRSQPRPRSLRTVEQELRNLFRAAPRTVLEAPDGS